MANRIPLGFHVSPGGCWTCISHEPNSDGYIRKRWAWGLEFLHRVVWRIRNGDIPAGLEIDHICGNRACCTPGHLRLISRADHLAHTNTTRYSQRRLDARRYWEEHHCTGAELGERFGVSFGSACRWIREWNRNEQN